MKSSKTTEFIEWQRHLRTVREKYCLVPPIDLHLGDEIFDSGTFDEAKVIV